MLLINCNAELKFKRTKYRVLSAAGNDNNNDNSNNIDNGTKIIFTIKTQNYISLL